MTDDYMIPGLLMLDEASRLLNLNMKLKEELMLVYKYADDNQLIICDWGDIKALCNYILDRKEEIKGNYFDEKNLKDLIRSVA